MRHLSMAYTAEPYKNGDKGATRRVSCLIRPGEVFMGVNRVMGFKKGEHPVPYGPSQCISNTPERLDEIIHRPYRPDGDGRSEVDLEGFPHLSPLEFVQMFCKNMRIMPERVIRRVRFRRLPG